MEPVANDHDVISVALYLKGDDLHPSTVTTALGVSPDKAFARGDRHYARGRPLTRKVGLWSLSVESPELSLQQKVDQLTRRMAHIEIDLRTLPGVEEAYLDVYVAAEDADHCLELTPEQLGWLQRRGLTVQLTFSP